MNRMVLAATAATLLAGCGSYNSSNNSYAQELTVGIVQKEIRQGMAQPDVAVALGSPNIVSKDAFGNEVWIYDRIASDIQYSKGKFGASAGAGVGGSSWLVIPTIGGSKESSRKTQSQKTLTVVIKFTDDQTVKTVSYHSSKF
jgi:outer membrane protein assembly factor BamE (lipoprotein component of BamABCDE complex)